MKDAKKWILPVVIVLGIFGGSRLYPPWMDIFKSWPAVVLLLSLFCLTYYQSTVEAVVKSLADRLVRVPWGVEFEPKVQSAPVIQQEKAPKKPEGQEKIREAPPDRDTLERALERVGEIEEVVLMARVRDWFNKIRIGVGLLEGLITQVMVNRYILAEKKQRILQMTLQDKIGALREPGYGVPSDIQGALNVVSGIIQIQEADLRPDHELLQQLITAYYPLEATRQYFLARVIRGA